MGKQSCCLIWRLFGLWFESVPIFYNDMAWMEQKMIFKGRLIEGSLRVCFLNKFTKQPIFGASPEAIHCHGLKFIIF